MTNEQPQLQVTTPNPFQEVTIGESREFPSRLVIYGSPKSGKSRFASGANDVFFINAENGLSYLDKKVRSTPYLTSFDDIIGWLKNCYNDDKFKCGTIVLDTLDWIENYAQQRLVKQHNAKSINDPSIKDFAYFKGVLNAAEDAATVLKWLDVLHTKKNIKSIVIAHSQIKTVDLPTQEPYERHELKLSKYLSNKVQEWADLSVFCDYSFHVTKDGKTSEPKPMLFAGSSASFVGGGRMRLDKELPVDYKILEQHITGKKIDSK